MGNSQSIMEFNSDEEKRTGAGWRETLTKDDMTEIGSRFYLALAQNRCGKKVMILNS